MGARAAALLLGLTLAAAGTVAAQVSPGPLAKAHAALEGTLNCTKCHVGGREAMRARCTACHGDVGWLAGRGLGFHGAAPVRAQPCASCHPDHAGRDFQLVQWPDGSSDRFDHARTGWRLEQTHVRTRCADCHTPDYRRSPAAALAPDGRSRWTGLDRACQTCHDDAHRGALGATCTACHDAGTWRATPGFSHDTTGYALTGEHRKVSCAKCHLDPRLRPARTPAGDLVPVYKPVPAASCASCHRDAHEGAFGARCADCHTTSGFEQITGSGFDHGRTGFPLRGRHVATPCASCHRDFTSPSGRRPASATCGACHADAHAGTATVGGAPADCGACHSERGFRPSTFPTERHQASRYPLEGKHVAVACSSCHRVDKAADAAARLGSARIVLRPASSRCLDCHALDHGDQLADRPGGGECAQCHSVDGFAPSRFGSAEHARLRLGLEGRHAEIRCGACHAAARAGLRPLPAGRDLGRAGFAFRVETDCVACHVDPHGGRFEPAGARPMAGGCRACHDLTRFSPTTVDVPAHERFTFALNGAHRATPCASCHQDLATPPARPAPSTLVAGGGRLRELPLTAKTACAECHESTHGAQFDARPDRGRCDACHGDQSFAPATRFDHDRDAAFPLRGGHQRVACVACHRPAPGQPAGRIVYKPLASKCEACHAPG